MQHLHMGVPNLSLTLLPSELIVANDMEEWEYSLRKYMLWEEARQVPASIEVGTFPRHVIFTTIFPIHTLFHLT